MDDLVQQLPYSQPILLTVGAILILFGRKLYWLALGIVVGFIGLILAQRYLNLSTEMELIVAAVACVAGSILAMVAKKMAVTLGGFGLGAIVAYYLATPFADQLQYQIWWVVLIGAVLGICFAAFVFDLALLVSSAIVGAGLVAKGLPLEGVEETAAFVVLTLVGLVVQARGKKGPKAD